MTYAQLHGDRLGFGILDTLTESLQERSQVIGMNVIQQAGPDNDICGCIAQYAFHRWADITEGSIRVQVADDIGRIFDQRTKTLFVCAQSLPGGALFAGPLDGENQLVDITGFLEICKRPGVDGLNGRTLRSMAGQQDALDAGGKCFEPAQQLQTGHILQIEVDQGHINIRRPRLDKRQCAGAGEDGLEAFGLEDILHGRQQVGVIVYEQDLQRF